MPIPLYIPTFPPKDLLNEIRRLEDLVFEYDCTLHKAIDDVVAYGKAAIKFTNKVDSGQARSKETYKELKACLERRV